MKDTPTPATWIDPDDLDKNISGNPHFESVLQARLSRRQVLKSGVAGALATMFGAGSLSACGGTSDLVPAAATNLGGLLGFTAVPKSRADVVAVPAGYTASVLYATGDPLTGGTSAYANNGTDASFDNRAGDQHDGMEYFGLSAGGAPDAASNARALLAMNHEAITQHFLHPNGATPNPRPAAEADKEIAAHGVSVVEISKGGAGFATVQNSPFNFRVTPLTPVEIAGPARGNALLKTLYSNAGTQTRGTINNCGTGRTPWGTLLTGEENFNGYFMRGAADNAARGDKSVTALNRYGRAQGSTSRHGWETAGVGEPYVRFNISKTGASLDGTDDYRNEMNSFGYIVEIDAYDKTAQIKKRTAMGRFAHESAAFGRLSAGKPVAVYMGDDSQGEYIYKYVSNTNWDASDTSPANRIAAGDKYLDNGKLFVAQFNADGSGNWIELNIATPAIAGYGAYTFADQGDVLVNARLAADAVGATRMDRPEWCGVSPTTGEIYYTLTNNSNRRLEPGAGQWGLDAANPRAYTDPRAATPGNAATSTSGNVNGHIIRLSENAGDHASTNFQWDVYLFGAQSDADPARVNLSSLTSDQDFSSPDGLVFSKATGICWIQTDDSAYTDATNCMMLAALPGTAGDGGTRSITYTKADSSVVNVTTRVGRAPTASTLKRFLVGPADCEITGLAESPDGRALFVNIQHPGETISAGNVGTPSTYVSHWPASVGYGAGGANGRPRSATIVITKNDGGVIGS